MCMKTGLLTQYKLIAAYLVVRNKKSFHINLLQQVLQHWKSLEHESTNDRPFTSFQLNICSRQWVLRLCFAFNQKALTEWKNPRLPLNSTASEPLDWTPLNKTSEQVQSFKTVWNVPTDFYTKRFSILSMKSHNYKDHREKHLISLVELHPLEPVIKIISWGQK